VVILSDLSNPLEVSPIADRMLHAIAERFPGQS